MTHPPRGPSVAELESMSLGLQLRHRRGARAGATLRSSLGVEIPARTTANLSSRPSSSPKTRRRCGANDGGQWISNSSQSVIGQWLRSVGRIPPLAR
jgi:hypothetical protein